MQYLMKCGHVANAHTQDGKPVCVICMNCNKDNGYNIIKRVCQGDDGIEERFAICSQHRGMPKPVPSKWELPFFQYKPDEKYDSYYCGCWGWD